MLDGSLTLQGITETGAAFAGLQVGEGAAPAVSRSSFDSNGSCGLFIGALATPVVTSSSFDSNGDYAVRMDADATPAFSGVTGTGNGAGATADVVHVFGTRSVAATLAMDSTATVLPYSGSLTLAPGAKAEAKTGAVFMSGGITVSKGATLTAGPGALFKSGDITAYGTLDAVGTEGMPVVFTSAHDPAGGALTTDTPTWGDWAGIRFIGSGSDLSRLSYAEVRYAGRALPVPGGSVEGTYNAGILIGGGATPSLVSTVTVASSRGNGIQVLDGSPVLSGITEASADYGLEIGPLATPTVTGSSFDSNGGYAVTMDADATPVLSGITGTGNGINLATGEGANVSCDAVEIYGTRNVAEVFTMESTATVPAYAGRFTVADGAKVVAETGALFLGADITLDQGVQGPGGQWGPGGRLTVKPGAVFKGCDITALGTLDAVGTLEDPIIFTSPRDPTGGAFMGSSPPAPGGWAGIRFIGPGSGASRLGHAEVRYAGGYGRIPDGAGIAAGLYRAGILIGGGAAPSLISTVTVASAEGSGIQVLDGSPTLRSITATGCGIVGLEIRESATPTVLDSSFDSNGFSGVYIGALAKPTVTNSSFDSNKVYAVSMHPNSTPVFTSVAGTGNGVDAIYFSSYDARNVTETLTLKSAETALPYAGILKIGADAHVSADPGAVIYGYGTENHLTVNVGGTLTLKPGSFVKGMDITALGTLDARGTASAPVVFTSAKDGGADAGGVTNGEPNNPSAMDWEGVLLEGPGASASRLEHVKVLYAGKYVPALRIVGSAASTRTIDHVTVSHTGPRGISVESGSPSIDHVTVTDVDSTGISVSDGSPSIDHAVVSRAGSTGIYVQSGSPSIDHATVTGAGSTGISVESGSPRISNTTVTGTGFTGISVSGASTVTDSVFSNNGSYGVLFDGASTGSTFKRCTIKGNGSAGVRAEAGASSRTAKINMCDIHGNGGSKDMNLDVLSGIGLSAMSVDASYVFWGRREGPRPVEAAMATVEPWLWSPYKTPKSKQVLGGYTECGRYGEPVNTATGNFYYSATDLSLAGTPALALSRTYNHQDADVPGPLGHGWHLECESFIQPDSDGNAVVTYPGGARKTFEASGTPGAYTPPEGTFETLAKGPGGGYTLVFTGGGRNAYAPQGWITSATDTYGNTVSYARDANGRLTSLFVGDTAPGGRAIAFAYNARGLITAASDTASRTVAYGYDADDNLTSFTDAEGNTTAYGVDGAHRITGVTYPEQLAAGTPAVVNHYDAEDRVDWQLDSYGSTMTFSYEDTQTTITDNRGNTLVHLRDGLWRQTGSIDAAGNATSSTYNATGLRGTVTDARRNTTAFTYDANGNTTSVTDPLGHSTRASYDASSNIQWAEDALGYRTEYGYDPTGRFLTDIHTPSTDTTFTYYPSGLVEAIASAGATTTFTYDAAGNPASVTDPLGNVSVSEYDAAGFLMATEDATGCRVEYERDALGRVKSVTDASGAIAHFTYDSNGNLVSVVNSLGKEVEYSRDAGGLLEGVTDALKNRTSYTYDENYNLKTVTDARGNTTTYAYSANDLLTSATDALGHTWVLDYDANGNLIHTWTPSGTEVSRAYNECNLPTRIEGDGFGYTFDYDDAHQPTSLSWIGTSDSLGISYGAEGRVEGTEDNLGAHPFSASYGYNGAGFVSTLGINSDFTRGFGYDLAGRLTTLTADATATPVTYSYDAVGRLTGRTMPDGSVTGITYDAAGCPESVTTTLPSNVFSHSYTRDLAGRIKTENGARYGYDDTGRLTSWFDPSAGATTTYGYDAVSNLTTVTVGTTVAKAFSFDAANRIAPGSGYVYDAGNLVQTPDKVFGYDGLGRLRIVKDKATGTVLETYTYDALNRRTSVTTTHTTYFHYDGASADVIAETDAAGNITTSYVRDRAGNLIAMERGGERYWYHTNARGDVVALTDGSGNTVNTYAYDPYGNPLATTEAVANPYRYAGYRYDKATGLYCLHNRYYDPASYRFITRDLYPGELDNPASMNPYVYCAGDPVNYVDPDGRASQKNIDWVMWVNGKYLHLNLNKTEAGLYIDNPGEASSMYFARTMAITLAKRYYPGVYNADDIRANAFKHAVWNAIGAFLIGADRAKVHTDAHECEQIKNPDQRDSSMMDFHNNAAGLAIGELYRMELLNAAGMGSYDYLGVSIPLTGNHWDNLALMVETAANNGLLTWLK
ncbi:MAG: right-handed parallel beta-helix repeat-containing protein [Coriobacteriia bacterium]|nr:right-handed parallel beta-helix repeat-containing protein [Coriobacteriia bacterium]